MPDTCNILLLGKTGVGKSALLNYLAGEKLAESGISAGGLTKGINRYPVIVNGHNCLISDSEGLESGSDFSWNDLVESELSPSRNVKDWYHIIIYCVSAAGSRIEDIELQTIKKLRNSGYGIIIAFTKSDVSSAEDTEKLKKTISGSINARLNGCDMDYIETGAVAGRNYSKFGREELAGAIIRQWGISVMNRLPVYAFGWCDDYLKKEKRRIKGWVWKQDMRIGGISTEAVMAEVNERMKSSVSRISRLIEKKKTDAFSENAQVLDAFSNMFLTGSDGIRTSSGLTFENISLESEPESFGNKLACILLGPFLLIPAIISAFTDDGSSTKRKICDEIDESFNKIKQNVIKQKISFENELKRLNERE